jgi:hypothetical protein
MSRGPGRIERAIRELLDAHPDLAFVTDDLVEHCYPGVAPIERKHQVSVLRAARSVLENDPDWRMRRIDAQGTGWVFSNCDSAMSSACAAQIAGVIYRSEKRAARKRYDWVRVPGGFRVGLRYGTIMERWAERRGCPYEPGHFDRRVWQRDDLCQWLDSKSGQEACNKLAGDVEWHRVCRGSDDATKQALLDAEHEIWLRGYKVWSEWLKARATWASKPHVWTKRYPAVVDNGKETLNFVLDPSALAERLRTLAAQNDPDVLRDGLASVAAELDGRGGAP